jgi:hypothetical protein
LNLKHQSELKDINIVNLQLKIVERAELADPESRGWRGATQRSDIELLAFGNWGIANRGRNREADKGENGGQFKEMHGLC